MRFRGKDQDRRRPFDRNKLDKLSFRTCVTDDDASSSLTNQNNELKQVVQPREQHDLAVVLEGKGDIRFDMPNSRYYRDELRNIHSPIEWTQSWYHSETLHQFRLEAAAEAAFAATFAEEGKRGTCQQQSHSTFR